MAFTVSQEAFSGPLGLLLELIEKQELEITKVSLTQVAEAYLKELESRQVPGEELADFLLVASRLIYLKSRELLPYLQVDDEEESVSKLQDQLRLYKEFVEAAEKLEQRYLQARMYTRPDSVYTPNHEPKFKPSENLSSPILHELYQGVLARLQPFLALQQASLEKTKSIEERLEELTEVLRSRATMSFSYLTQGAKSKLEVVMSFLALLELLRRRAIKVSQGSTFGDIQLKRL